MSKKVVSVRRIVWPVLVGAVVLSGYFVYAYERALMSPEMENALTLVSLTDVHQGGQDAAVRIGNELGWPEDARSAFVPTLRSVQWDALNEELAMLFSDTFGWGGTERELFLASAAVFTDDEYDLLGRVFVPDTYVFYRDATPLEVAEKLAARAATFATEDPDAFFAEIPDETKEAVLQYVRGETERLPDIVPLPPLDVVLRDNAGRKELAFTTVYYNQGVADLKLQAEEETALMLGDMERTVYQQIERVDGTVREREAGVFFWHEEHLHYHFSDFVDYVLEPVAGGETDVPLREKSTFCIRDVSKVELPGVEQGDATYKICGRERQGVSVGWGDAYFHTYPDQFIDVTNLPAGQYRLTFHANPRGRFEESDYENNISSVLIELDPSAGTATVLETVPERYPTFEHIYTEDIYI